MTAGSVILGPVLSPAGFTFQLTGTGHASGGTVDGAYPGYSTDPLDGFRHLAADLAGPLWGFRDGDHGEFERARRGDLGG